MASQKKNSVLLKTSSNADVQYSGGKILINGLDPIKQTSIIDFSQTNYRAERSQVVTIGPSSSYTPAASTVYTVEIGNSLVRDHGYTQVIKKYKYTTPPVLTSIGANAALQREYINLALVAKINADSNNFVVAASLLTGTGFTITDEAGYFPYNRQGAPNRLGANLVRVVTNTDGSGFVAADMVLTTSAIYSVGVGADLANSVPVMDFMTGNLISGEFDTPLTYSTNLPAVSGQKYNLFSISHLVETALPTAFNGQARVYLIRNAQVWVDNGAGTDTANLAGYTTFARQMQRGIFKQYQDDPCSQVDFLDNVILFQGAAGAVPTATGANKMVSDAKWIYTQIGSQTLTTPTPGNDGLILDQDLVDTEGAEYTPSLLTSAPQEFIVGKTPFSVFARLKAGDYTDAAWLVGFRRKAAHAADFNDYTDLAAVGTLAANGDLITTQGILNNAATVSTSTAIVPTDAAYVTVEVNVAMDGAVTTKLNDITYPVYSVGTTALIFDAGDIMIPFVRYANVSTGDPDLVLNEIGAVAAIWKY